MSSQVPRRRVKQAVPAKIPDEREYDSEPDAELDRRLCEAIEAAADADNDYLKKLLATELGTHYYGCQ